MTIISVGAQEVIHSGSRGFVDRFYMALTRALIPKWEYAEEREVDLLAIQMGESIPLEIKSSSCANAFRIDWVQLESHIKLTEPDFPYLSGCYYYILWGYSSRENLRKGQAPNERKTILTKSVVDGKGELFLGRRTNQCWIVPVRLMKQIGESFPLRRGKFLGDDFRPRPYRAIPRQLLKSIVDGRAQVKESVWTPKHGHVDARISLCGKRLYMNFSVIMFSEEGLTTLDLKRVTWE